jgi:cell division protein FtsI (penicillin-binding protein 3)
VLRLLVCGAGGLVWRAVELQLKDHEFLGGQGDARFSRVPRSPPRAARSPIATANRSPCRRRSIRVGQSRRNWRSPATSCRGWRRRCKRDKNEIARRLTVEPRPRIPLPRAPHAAGRGAEDPRARDPGVYLMREYRRYYPAGEVAGHIIGFTSVDDEGQEGLELAFDHWLAGEDGAKRVIQDRYGKIVQNVEGNPRDAARGRNLVLSIDCASSTSRIAS